MDMNLFMPAWGSRGLGWLYVSTSANDSARAISPLDLVAFIVLVRLG